MSSILPPVRYSVKERLLRHLRRCRDAGLRLRCLIIINLLNGRGATKQRRCWASTIRRSTESPSGLVVTKKRACLMREDNGQEKLTETFLGILDQIVRDSPQDYGWRRPTWTRELLVKTMAQETGVRIALTTMSRALALIGARRGRPRPRVRCPWPKAAQTRRLNKISRLLEALPRGHVGVYEDEVDVHLNPKIGLDWMGLSQQKDVMTPGNNQKRLPGRQLGTANRTPGIRGK